MPATSLASLIVRARTEALTLDAELIVNALDAQDTRGAPPGLEGLGFQTRALRFECLPPLAKAADGLACAHLLRVGGYRHPTEKGKPAGVLKPSTPEAEATDLLWMDADQAVHILRVAGIVIAPARFGRGAWFFRAAAVGIDRILDDPSVLPRQPSASLEPQIECWRAVYG